MRGRAGLAPDGFEDLTYPPLAALNRIDRGTSPHHATLRCERIDCAALVDALFKTVVTDLAEVPSRAVLKFGWRDLRHEDGIGSGGEVNRLLCG